jgi:hypothetical protein
VANNKFDDTRSSIQRLISVFYNKIPISKYRNVKFEQDVLQIVNRKKVSNFELFAYTFDSIYDFNFQNKYDFHVHIQREQNKKSKENRLVNLYFSSEDNDDREQTIELAFGIYNQHQSMIQNFEEFFSDNLKSNKIIENNIFDNSFYSKKYKFLDISFDIFLSHRYYLRFYNIIVFYVLTVHYGLSVYVDWIFDHTVDRRKLSEDTVKLLKYRLNQSKKLVFFNIVNSYTTNWMAWEVGYFSCLRNDGIAILDLDGYCKGNKNVEVLSSSDKIVFDDVLGLRLLDSNISIRQWI